MYKALVVIYVSFIYEHLYIYYRPIYLCINNDSFKQQGY